jgi:hypothetical protein
LAPKPGIARSVIARKLTAVNFIVGEYREFAKMPRGYCFDRPLRIRLSQHDDTIDKREIFADGLQ